jgi:hypothetical protein
MDDQERYLVETKIGTIILRGIKKLITELTSIKTLFLGFICVAMAYNWIGDTVGIIGGLATLGVKEIPGEVFTAIMSKITPGQK